jgi:hypothetical protein
VRRAHAPPGVVFPVPCYTGRRQLAAAPADAVVDMGASVAKN